jgi:NADPH-dependent curcumin reductase CurA
MRGFIVTDHTRQYPDFIAEVGALIKSGAVRWEQTVVDGLEQAPQALIGLFNGSNVGKMLVKLDTAERQTST